MKEYDVIGLGNPMVEILMNAEESHLNRFNLKKGIGNLTSKKEQEEIIIQLKSADKNNAGSKTAGDSTANTLSALSILGAKVVYIGRVGNDEDGSFYEKTLKNDNFTSKITKCDNETGQCLVLITKDRQRSFAFDLGASRTLKKEDILEEDIKKSKILHITGYQLTEPGLKEATLHALDLAKKHKLLISIDLADSGQVRRFLNEYKSIIEKYADIIFANEEEAFAFTGLKAEKAVNEIKKNALLVCVKLGEKGSLINHKGKMIKIAAKKANAVDTTGAGDAYSAGILFGLVKGIDMAKAGKLASHISSKVVEQLGARLNKGIILELKAENGL